MKKHALIQVDFSSTVKLSKAEATKLDEWFGMASLALEEILKEGKLIHPSWLKGTEAFQVSVLLCGGAKIRRLNLEHRSKDTVTDVLSFPNYETLRKPKPKDGFPGGEVFVGDLAICHQRTVAQAEEFSIGYFDEFIHLFMHGFIHLVGYDHEVSLKDETLMEGWEAEALNRFSEIKKRAPEGPLKD